MCQISRPNDLPFPHDNDNKDSHNNEQLVNFHTNGQGYHAWMYCQIFKYFVVLTSIMLNFTRKNIIFGSFILVFILLVFDIWSC